MFSKIFVIFILLTVQAFATNVPQAANMVQLGGTEAASTIFLPEGNAPGYFCLVGGTDNVVANDFYPMAKPFATAGYQVTSGKTFKTIKNCEKASTAGQEIQFVSATSAITQSLASLTGGLYETGFAASYSDLLQTVNAWECRSNPLNWTSLTFPGFQVKAANVTEVMVCGKEE